MIIPLQFLIHSIVTQPNDWNKNTTAKLSNILRRFLKDSNASK